MSKSDVMFRVGNVMLPSIPSLLGVSLNLFTWNPLHPYAFMLVRMSFSFRLGLFLSTWSLSIANGSTGGTLISLIPLGKWGLTCSIPSRIHFSNWGSSALHFGM
uniref:Uncharacterized protein n=1 Tax=Cacopsylla melanoneura TaxID=428564 RepID=A0A8D8S0H9_9HEMI